MAANVKIILFFNFIIVISTVIAQNTNSTSEPLTTTNPLDSSTPSQDATPIERNQDLAECTCDLIANACDVNCCCDMECDDGDLPAFSQCIDQYTDADSQLCYQSNIILTNNSPYVVNTTVPGLFCIQVDNYEERNYFEPVDIVNTTEMFSEYLASYGKYSFKPDSSDDQLPTEPYQSGDPIYTVYDSNAVGILPQPAALTSQECKDTNPAAYMYSLTSECVRFVTALDEQCETESFLNAHTYFKYFKVVASPVAFADVDFGNDTDDFTTEAPDTTTESSSSTVNPLDDIVEGNILYNSSYAINITTIGPHVCIDIDGINRTCQFDGEPTPPEYDPTGICINALVAVTYNIVYNNSDGGIVSVDAVFTLADLTANSTMLTQAFATSFSKGDEVDVFVRSGNPGYQIGQPVMAGSMTDNIDSEGNTVYAIELDSNRDNWLTMVTTAATGTCSNNTDERVSVMFGEDMRSGCYVRINFSNFTESCGLIQEVTLQALRGYDNDVDKYIATFATAEVEKVGDWVKVIDQEVSQPIPAGRDTCSGIVTGMHIEILYAAAGALQNPQYRIVGAKYHYKTEDLHFQCVGPYCQSGYDAPQMVEMVSSVGFVDVSQPAVARSGEKPEITARLPEDFFYPFV